MADDAQHKVVILYEHALLGEGIAKYLHAQIGVEATLGSARSLDAIKSALAVGPEVVIFESDDPFEQFDLTTLVPHAVLIDVSTVITRGSVAAPCAAGLEQILQAVRDSSGIAGPAETDVPVTAPNETEAAVSPPAMLRAAATSPTPTR